ncbi:MAG: hypothetical protein JJU36_07235, partial [Phycisphaeraceae bacterium]|nr:hypothetical protein [Phycisphaeraceae bacterium]
MNPAGLESDLPSVSYHFDARERTHVGQAQCIRYRGGRGGGVGAGVDGGHGSFEYEGDGNWDIGPFYTSLAAQGFAGFGDPPDWFTYHHGSQYAS